MPRSARSDFSERGDSARVEHRSTPSMDKWVRLSTAVMHASRFIRPGIYHLQFTASWDKSSLRQVTVARAGGYDALERYNLEDFRTPLTVPTDTPSPVAIARTEKPCASSTPTRPRS